MSKTYATRLADRIREILPEDTEFEIMPDEPWRGYLFVHHPNDVDASYLPLTEDKRAAVTEDAVQKTLRGLAWAMYPYDYYQPPKWRGLKREAHNAWVAQTGIEL